MVWTPVLIALVIGFGLGLGASLLLRLIQGKTVRSLAEELYKESEEHRKASIEAIIENMKATFGNLSLEALSKSTEEFLKLAKARLESERETGLKELDSKKGLIDQQLHQMTSKLEDVSRLIKELEKDRGKKVWRTY